MANKDTRDLKATIDGLCPGGNAYETSLDTSSQVIRRVTDGIYRKPWSAIRELVSNSYDADATFVRIDTDYPRFESLTIQDDGLGFSSDTLAHMLKNIGGSAKRSDDAIQYGIASRGNSSESPGGRKLIGKLGIGLFAVSQLTHEFAVITKQKGDSFRTVADVLLFRHQESSTDSPTAATDTDGSQAATADSISHKGDSIVFRAGSAVLYKVPADNEQEHGTSVVLRNLLPATKEELSSAALWAAADNDAEDDPQGESSPSTPIKRPRFHVGYVEQSNPEEFLVPPKLPWNFNDEPLKKFEKLASAFCDVYSANAGLRPSIEEDLDNYLQFIWNLSLAAPIPYLWKHPFDATEEDGIKVFRFANYPERSAVPVPLANKSVRDALGLKNGLDANSANFRILVDDVELRRPLGINGESLRKLRQELDSDLVPLLFVGQYAPELSGIPEKVRGGYLSFESYLLWRERTTPKEHAGVLVRVNEASGTLFDASFFDHRVSEINRKQQATMEIFVDEGLDAALNIDRETFNTFHPHYQLLKDWVHRAFRQFATRDKGLRKELQQKRTGERLHHAAAARQELTQKFVHEWDESAQVPNIRFEHDLVANAGINTQRELVYAASQVFPEFVGAKLNEKDTKSFSEQMSIIASIASYLQSVGLFDNLDTRRQEIILRDLRNIIFYQGPNE